MRRSARNLAKLEQNFEELPEINQFEKIQANTNKLRKIKELKTDARCQSSQSYSRETKNKPVETSRTRSLSPMSHSPPLDIKLPLKKFYKIYSKIVEQLESVKNLSENKKNETDSLVDLRRQLQRADEFSIRFSRNNLYETKRIINEVKKLFVPYSLETLPPKECNILCKKIILAYQAASQSLQIYINYVKNPVNLEVPEKIKELVLLIADLFLCCEHLSLPVNEVYIQNEAVKICNQLISLLSQKTSVGEYVGLREADLAKKKVRQNEEEKKEVKKFSMYKSKVTNPAFKVKQEVPKKKFGISYLLGNKAKRLRKKDEKKARITQEIYTQKANSRQEGKLVKFEASKHDTKGDIIAEKKLLIRKPKFFTPREVKSQDDDVETMIQTIGDDDGLGSRTCSTVKEIDEVSDCSSNFNKSSFRELLLEAIEDLQNSDKKEQKATLKKLLNSIKNCSKSQNNTPRPSRVKVYHFLSKDLEEEANKKIKESSEPDIISNVNFVNIHTEKKARDEIISRQRRLNIIFQSIKPNKFDEIQADIVPRGKIKLKLSEELMADANKYRRSFSNYRKNNIMYKKTLANRPWDLVGKIADHIILDILKEISLDFQNDIFLQRLYSNELLEVVT